jgi:DNA-binding MarR family transcriptional regulator/catechol 2,3-dioxygenase-like lactoylglutathione lyase family enzyme
MDDDEWDELGTPALMRSARGAYAQSIRAQLAGAGIGDLPRNGASILAGIGASGGLRQDLPAELGVTKQAVSQVIDVLVRRGYLERRPDPGDRRRVELDLTERGEEAVAAVLRGIAEVDRQLAETVSAEQVSAMRAVLAAMARIKQSGLSSGAGRPRPARQMRRISPIFGVRDLRAALAHYAALGFRTLADSGGDQYGFANRDGVGLHLAADPGRPAHAGHPAHDGVPGSAYLYVRDADALYEEWTRPGIGGHTHAPEPTPYGLREGSHTDPDGNLIRFGSPSEDDGPTP